jgi:uroporphyrin-III C-methyltransferase
MGVSGIIYFVGSGPGDPALLTIKAMELMRSADLISYDGFVSREILELIPASTAVITCTTSSTKGKKHTPAQAVAPLIAAAKKGKTVVRLKGGDPWVFGRCDREARAAVKAGIPFEIVPGVGAATACFASFGLPLTEKKFSDCLQVRAGYGEHPAGDATPTDKSTLVYLTTENCSTLLAEQLIEQGFAPNTPACAISQCTLADEQIVFATLKTLGKKTANLPEPLLIGVGKALRKSRRIESPKRAGQPLTDYKMLDLMIRGMSEFEWIIPDTPETAYILLKRMGAMKKDPAQFDNLRLVATGESIDKIYSSAGIKNFIRVNTALDDRLLADIRTAGPLVGGRFLVPHLSGKKPPWTAALIKAGAIVVGIEIIGASSDVKKSPKGKIKPGKSAKKM